MKKIILIVDDDRLTLATAQQLLEEQYRVVAVNSGKQAYKYLERHTPDLILLDINMPEIGGFEVMETLRKDPRWCKIPVIFLTADRSAETETECFRVGANDFIAKPFEPNVILSRIRSTIELDGYRKDLQRRLDEKTKEMERVTIQAIMTVANTVDAKDDYTKGHSMRVAAYSELLAQRLGWSEEEIQNIYYVAMLHDVGKIGVPDAVLNKPFMLTDLEFRLIKGHTLMGAEILNDFKMFPNISVGAKYHHERYDGTGYPEGLKGESIPLVARVIGLVDSYDAMTSNRVYRRRLHDDAVLEELQKGKGSQWDPELVDIFIKLIEEGALEKLWMPEEDLATPIFGSGKILGDSLGNENVLESPVDYLTGLLSRKKGEKDISEKLRAEGGCLILIDLDHFGQINDAYGHLMGDYALKTVADVLREISGNELVCRVGGDEFLYYLTGVTDEAEISKKAEELLGAFRKKQEEVDLLKNSELSMGISISGTDGREFDELYRRADKALYLVKQRSGMRYGFYQKTSILRTPEQSQGDLKKIMDAIRTHDSYNGVFRVDYTEFTHIYDFVTHMSERDKKETQLLLFTLFSSNGSEVRLERMETAMQCMEQAICKSLRGVDVGARYSSSQFLVVLMGTERENVRVVTDRIVQNYFKLYGEKDITLTYDMAKFD
ncbi:MAG: diguanylate cyclase [Bacteroidales bacterium]|nr:diguanylate cyclase [Bacteroidales bacterium]MCM1416309.1 diguanylate cyclase [bacterium]MCM1424245.1 diguanylate cyclase [bacterium]